MIRHESRADTVHDARPDEEKVIWADGSWDYRDELVSAVKGEASLYEVEARGSECTIRTNSDRRNLGSSPKRSI